MTDFERGAEQNSDDFEILRNLMLNEEGLLTDLAIVQELKQIRLVKLQEQARYSEMHTEDKIKIAVLLNGPNVRLKEADRDANYLAGLNRRLEAAAGEQVLWLGKYEDKIFHSFMDGSTTATRYYLGLARTGDMASLEVDADNGEIFIPVTMEQNTVELESDFHPNSIGPNFMLPRLCMTGGEANIMPTDRIPVKFEPGMAEAMHFAVGKQEIADMIAVQDPLNQEDFRYLTGVK
jgi:hypothetical protein